MKLKCDYMPHNFNGVSLNLPQFDGHFKQDTIDWKGVSNEKKEPIHT